MPRAQYTEIQAKTALNQVRGMPFQWSLNPYAGCPHRCTFCFALQYWVTAERGTPADFGAQQVVKVNVPELLARELAGPRLRGQEVVVGTATDPYQPAEARYRLTRRALELLSAHGNPISLLTKGPLIVRDTDVLASMARPDVRVYFSITTVDLNLWRSVEPGTANPYLRLRAMQRLRAAGVQAGVLMAPVLPGITDAAASISAVAEAARAHDAVFFEAAPLRLMPHVKQHYLAFVEQAFPVLLPRYARGYPGANAPADYRAALARRVQAVRRQHGFSALPMRRAAGLQPRRPALAPVRQLTLPLD